MAELDLDIILEANSEANKNSLTITQEVQSNG